MSLRFSCGLSRHVSERKHRGPENFDKESIWLSPADLPKGEIDIDADMADVLHIHLPASQFVSNSLGIETTGARIGLRYEAAFEDPLPAEIAHAVASELRSQTAAGGLLIDSLETDPAAY